MDIVVFQTAFLGDTLLSIPLIRQIRRWQSGARIHLVCRPGLGELMLRLRIVETYFELDKSNRDSRSRWKAWVSSLQPKFIFCPHRSLRTHGMMFGVRYPTQTIGFANWWNYGFFSKRCIYRRDLPDALRQLSLLAAVSQEFKDKLDEVVNNPKFYNSSETGQDVDFRKIALPDWADMTVLSSKRHHRRLVLAPGSVWATKRWTESGYRSLCERLLLNGYEVVLMGSPDERELCERLADGLSINNLCGKLSLYESALFLAESAGLVANDSGAMHLASLSQTPTVAIFGPTVLGIGYRPWNENSMVVQSNLSCRPCGRHGAQVCPIGTHACMKSISIDQILRALQTMRII